MQNEQFHELKYQVKQFKISRGDIRERYPEEIRNSVKELHRRGSSISEISNAIEVPYDSIQNWVSPKVSKKFKEVKIKTATPKAVVEKSSVFHIVISKNGFDVKMENSSPEMLLRILKGL